MAVRQIIEIDEEKCDGCGQCVPSCAEGALKVVDGKARLMGDVLCDGLGACLGECPQGALHVIDREAADFDVASAATGLGFTATGPGSTATRPGFTATRPAAATVGPGSTATGPASTATGPASAATGPAATATGPASTATGPAATTVGLMSVAAVPLSLVPSGGGCPGSRVTSFNPRPDPAASASTSATGPRPATALRQWPIQLHLVPPTAPFFERAHVLLAADCVAFAVGDFHSAFLDGRALAIACPKLDQRQETYVPKLRAMIDEARIETLTVAVMEVPCCSGLLRLAQEAAASASRRIPIKHVQIGVQGQVLREEWL